MTLKQLKERLEQIVPLDEDMTQVHVSIRDGSVGIDEIHLFGEGYAAPVVLLYPNEPLQIC